MSEAYFKSTAQEFFIWVIQALRNMGTGIDTFKVLWCQIKEKRLLWDDLLILSCQGNGWSISHETDWVILENSGAPKGPTNKDHREWKRRLG